MCFPIRYVTDGTVAIFMSALFFCIPSNLPRCCGKSRDGMSACMVLIIFCAQQVQIDCAAFEVHILRFSNINNMV